MPMLPLLLLLGTSPVVYVMLRSETPDDAVAPPPAPAPKQPHPRPPRLRAAPADPRPNKQIAGLAERARRENRGVPRDSPQFRAPPRLLRVLDLRDNGLGALGVRLFARALRGAYGDEAWESFAAQREAMDPKGVFLNEFLRSQLGVAA